MAEAASEWDGRVLVRPSAKYTSVWDAHIIHGCVCDPGWVGHDCSLLECPKGDDPLTTVRELQGDRRQGYSFEDHALIYST